TSRVTSIDSDGSLYGYAASGGFVQGVRWSPPATVCGPADVGGTGGVPGADGRLDNNDFVVFIDLFFAQSPTADMGSTGGVPGPDGAWNNNDFVVFIDRFFAGC
ncbi:MAG TPA: GC-type dockerin domain-anchored protein, partial [Phycisphaerales bacterium]|nr:GC-type dockerin domain-anchored protein [Phycisphaerales bacterium]